MTARRVLVWLTEGTWEATVDAAAQIAATGPSEVVEVELVHVVDAEITEALHGAYFGLLGRGARIRDPAGAAAVLAEQASAGLLADAATRLGRPATRTVRVSRVEREVVAACEGATLLVCARDGDHSRLGPHSLGHHTRFVVDHAPCAVLLIWPDEAPSLGSLPPPPDHPRHHGDRHTPDQHTRTSTPRPAHPDQHRPPRLTAE
jgi:nucleotide-binding universal stress UspA family protein